MVGKCTRIRNGQKEFKMKASKQWTCMLCETIIKRGEQVYVNKEGELVCQECQRCNDEI